MIAKQAALTVCPLHIWKRNAPAADVMLVVVMMMTVMMTFLKPPLPSCPP